MTELEPSSIPEDAPKCVWCSRPLEPYSMGASIPIENPEALPPNAKPLLSATDIRHLRRAADVPGNLRLESVRLVYCRPGEFGQDGRGLFCDLDCASEYAVDRATAEKSRVAIVVGLFKGRPLRVSPPVAEAIRCLQGEIETLRGRLESEHASFFGDFEPRPSSKEPPWDPEATPPADAG